MYFDAWQSCQDLHKKSKTSNIYEYLVDPIKAGDIDSYGRIIQQRQVYSQLYKGNYYIFFNPV